MSDADDAWLTGWLDRVAAGEATMSQRSEAAIAKHGGLDRAAALARARGVHLVALTTDEGKAVVAASVHPFLTLC